MLSTSVDRTRNKPRTPSLQRRLNFSAIASLGACLLAPSHARAQQAPQTQLTVRVLGGYKGKLIRHQAVVITTQPSPAGPASTPLQSVTDRSGIATFTIPSVGFVQTSVPKLRSCSLGQPQGIIPDEAGIPIASILGRGVVTQDGCKPFPVTAKPGEVVLFVQHRHWWHLFSL